jgi:hypothetical protein
MISRQGVNTKLHITLMENLSSVKTIIQQFRIITQIRHGMKNGVPIFLLTRRLIGCY